MRSWYSQTLGVSDLVFEFLETFLPYRSPCPWGALLGKVSQLGTSVGEVSDMSLVKVAGCDETSHALHSLLRVILDDIGVY